VFLIPLIDVLAGLSDAGIAADKLSVGVVMQRTSMFPPNSQPIGQLNCRCVSQGAKHGLISGLMRDPDLTLHKSSLSSTAPWRPDYTRQVLQSAFCFTPIHYCVFAPNTLTLPLNT
jgi:hypothetical protein